MLYNPKLPSETAFLVTFPEFVHSSFIRHDIPTSGDHGIVTECWLVLPREIAQHVGVDVQAKVGQVVEVLAGH